MAPTSTSDLSDTTSMKGYELYSWRDKRSGEWYFALLPGTNRLKTFDEIAVPPNQLKTVNSLRQELAKLPRGEHIEWITWTDNHLGMPPNEIVNQIKATSTELGLDLSISPQ